jgi:hypothetical protein
MTLLIGKQTIHEFIFLLEKQHHMTTQLHFPNLKALERNGLFIELETNLFLVGEATSHDNPIAIPKP